MTDPDQFHSPLTRRLMGAFASITFIIFALAVVAGVIAWAITKWQQVIA